MYYFLGNTSIYKGHVLSKSLASVVYVFTAQTPNYYYYDKATRPTHEIYTYCKLQSMEDIDSLEMCRYPAGQ